MQSFFDKNYIQPAELSLKVAKLAATDEEISNLFNNETEDY